MTDPDRPSHLIADPWNDKTALCGVKLNRPEGLPQVALFHAPAHIAGYGLRPCPACVEQITESAWDRANAANGAGYA